MKQNTNNSKYSRDTAANLQRRLMWVI